MNKFAQALILGIILATPTAVVIPEAQAQNTPPAKTEPVDTVEQKPTPIRKIYTEDGSSRRNRKKPLRMSRSQMRKIARKKQRQQIRRQQRRQARIEAIQNFGKPLSPR